MAKSCFFTLSSNAIFFSILIRYTRVYFGPKNHCFGHKKSHFYSKTLYRACISLKNTCATNLFLKKVVVFSFLLKNRPHISIYISISENQKSYPAFFIISSVSFQNLTQSSTLLEFAELCVSAQLSQQAPPFNWLKSTRAQ